MIVNIKLVKTNGMKTIHYRGHVYTTDIGRIYTSPKSYVAGHMAAFIREIYGPKAKI